MDSSDRPPLPRVAAIFACDQKITAQLDHFQYLFLLRLIDALTDMQKQVESDIVRITGMQWGGYSEGAGFALGCDRAKFQRYEEVGTGYLGVTSESDPDLHIVVSYKILWLALQERLISMISDCFLCMMWKSWSVEYD